MKMEFQFITEVDNKNRRHFEEWEWQRKKGDLSKLDF